MTRAVIRWSLLGAMFLWASAVFLWSFSAFTYPVSESEIRVG